MSNSKCQDWLVLQDEDHTDYDFEIVAACNRTEGHSGWHASGAWSWEQDPCPHCGAKEPQIEGGSTPGYTGAAITWVNFLCCGAQDVDDSADNLEAVR